MLDCLREAATPPRGVELFSADGAAFTGIVIIDEPADFHARRTAAAGALELRIDLQPRAGDLS